jgi:lysozyme
MAIPGLKAIFDISQHQRSVDFQKAKQAGMEAVIIKATQGVNFVDPRFRQHLAGAKQAGLMIGMYHFGTASDGVGQADDFLEAADPGPDNLLVLDFEENPTGTQMTLDIAETFVKRVHEKTNRFPAFYCGHLYKELMGTRRHPTFSQCPLWLAAYVQNPRRFIQATWPDYTLWQYTDGTNGHETDPVAGVGKCDRNTFKGTREELAAIWKSGLVPAEPAVA